MDAGFTVSALMRSLKRPNPYRANDGSGWQKQTSFWERLVSVHHPRHRKTHLKGEKCYLNGLIDLL